MAFLFILSASLALSLFSSGLRVEEDSVFYLLLCLVCLCVSLSTCVLSPPAVSACLSLPVSSCPTRFLPAVHCDARRLLALDGRVERSAPGASGKIRRRDAFQLVKIQSTVLVGSASAVPDFAARFDQKKTKRTRRSQV